MSAIKTWYFNKLHYSAWFGRFMSVLVIVPIVIISIFGILVNMLMHGLSEARDRYQHVADVYKDIWKYKTPSKSNRSQEAEDLWSAQ